MNARTRFATTRVLHGGAPYRTPQGPVYAPGVSTQTVGSEVLFLGLVTLKPGQRTRAHIHERHESAFYMLSGDAVEVWSGGDLEHCSTAHAGDFLFIPAGVPHVAVNRGRTPAVMVGARNDPAADENVVMQPQLDGRVP